VVIEDDHHISDLVAMYLRRDGFRVLQADDGESGLALVDRERPRLVIVDIGLPGALDGFDVCRRLRTVPAAHGADGGAAGTGGTPVLILSARDDEVDRILGLELGADDYVTKPFSARELVARVHAILRRTGVPRSATPAVVALGGIEIDTGRREVRRDGEVVAMATREFDLLAYLVDNLGLALSRRQLLNGVWGRDWFGDERTVDVHVRQLRKKLGDDLPLATVWGVGYRLG
jgi:DNA-binding response OmpR family regulator